MPTAEIELARLHEIGTGCLSVLVNDPRVLRHMPLAAGVMDAADIREWVAVKERIWDERGFGPWAIRIGGEFAGWGGLQPWDDDVEVALVLRPEFWGWGRSVLDRFLEQAFDQLELTHVVAAVPPSRGRGRALLRLGFTLQGTADVDGLEFLVYRLLKRNWPRRHRREGSSPAQTK